MDVVLQAYDLSEDYLQFASQIGADGFDISPRRGWAEMVPGVAEQGYADERGVRALMDRLRRWGLRLCRVSTVQPANYLLGRPGGDEEVDNLCRTVEALGRAGVPLTSVPLDYIPVLPEANETATFYSHRDGVHRGGYTMTAVDLAVPPRGQMADLPASAVDVDTFFARCIRLYERLVPIAEAGNIRLVLHPSDPPLPDAPFSPRRWSQIMDAVPSTHSGLLYCVGTRYESGVDSEADIRAIGRRGKIFHVHFRNVRGTLPTDGGYEEVALHDGDMHMFRILRALKSIGYDGGLQVDHLPRYSGDNAFQGRAAAYAVGSIKALLAALDVE